MSLSMKLATAAMVLLALMLCGCQPPTCGANEPVLMRAHGSTGLWAVTYCWKFNPASTQPATRHEAYYRVQDAKGKIYRVETGTIERLIELECLTPTPQPKGN